MKLTTVRGLLLLGMLCAAAYAAEEDPKPETAAASNSNATISQVEGGPIARDDTYTFKARAGQFLQRLMVLDNDWPGRPHIMITDVSDTQGIFERRITNRGNYLEYYIANYDGVSSLTETFWYSVASVTDDAMTATAYVNVEIEPATDDYFTPNDDAFRFVAPPKTARPESKPLDVLANDKGSNLRIVKLDTRALRLGEATIASDRKKIYYTYNPGDVKATVTDRLRYYVSNGRDMPKKARVVIRIWPQNQVTVQANPDYYSFALDNNGNLPQTKLDVLANDKGSGITIVGVTPLWDKPGTLSASADFIYYHVDQYRGPSYSITFEYRIQDNAGVESSTQSTIDIYSHADQPQLKDDVVTVTTSPDYHGNFVINVRVLENDKPSGGLKLVPSGVEKLGDPYGVMTVERDSKGDYLKYTLDTTTLYPGQTIADKFMYTAAEIGTSAKYQAIVTMNIEHRA